MIPEQRRKILEAAAKACCYTPYWNPSLEEWQKDLTDPYVNGMVWNPIDNPADTAEMCAELRICTLFFDIEQKVSCGFLAQDERPTLAHIEPYGDSRLKAWMYAATMVAAKIGGHTE